MGKVLLGSENPLDNNNNKNKKIRKEKKKEKEKKEKIGENKMMKR